MKDILNKEQFETMLKVFYLASWMLDAQNGNNEEGSAFRESVLDLQQQLYSFAEEYGSDELVHKFRSSDEMFPPVHSEENDVVYQVIDDYNEVLFWEELSDRMAERDLYKLYGDKLSEMETEEFIKKKSLIVERYNDEFEKHGIEYLQAQE